MYRYKLIIAYDGTNYFGWQVQKKKSTIAQTLQDTFARVFSTPVTVVGVSRTDAGVHAQGQVATLTSPRFFEPRLIHYAWNNLLPADILVSDVQAVAYSYNPFNDIDYKIYWYFIFEQRPSPFFARYGWHVRSGLDVNKLAQALQCFVGTHDFRLFVTDDDRGDDTVRRIDEIRLEFDEQMQAHKIIIKGPKFLRHMIRRIVGAAVEVALRTDLPVDYLHTMLNDYTLMRTLVSAPAQGLVLHKIVYLPIG